MSIAACERCSRFIDTDENPEAYEVTDEDCNTIALGYPLCDHCKDNFLGLLELQKKVDAFTSEIFDWVSTLGKVGFLHQCYEFKAAIEKYVDPKKEQKNG